MNKIHLPFAFFLGIVLLCSCEKKEAKTDKGRYTRQEILKKIKSARLQAKDISSFDAKRAFWNKKLDADPFKGDSVLKAYIHFRLAGVYYTINNQDSIKWHMQRSWDLMENQQGYDEIKIRLNSGQGNLATIEQHLHEANYYFNRATQILTSSDTTLDIAARGKVNVLLATAQSDAQLYQFKQAIERNRKALSILDTEIPEEQKLRYRAYSQLAADYYRTSDVKADSVYKYTQKMEQVYLEHPDKVSPRFLYDRKVLYFDETDQLDSTFYYQRKLLDIDKQILEANSNQDAFYSNVFKDYANLAATYVDLNKPDSAKYYIDLGAFFLKEHRPYLDSSDFIVYRKSLIHYLFATDQYQKAYEQHNKLFEIYETLYENKYAQATAEMSTIYELQAKEKSISKLNEEVTRTESKLWKNRLLLIITTLSTLLALAIAVVLYYIHNQRELKRENERVQLQKNAIELEQQLLRTQMEPHFIFNTLSVLQSYVRLDEKNKALKYLNQFGRLLRSSLELSRESLVPLNEEIDTLENYLSLQQMRYENSFDYQINRPDADEMDQIVIPPMHVQPFVENAVIHGVRNVARKGLIIVDFALQDGMLQVTITDNGPGVDATINNASQHKQSLSTVISRERLEILAKEKAREVAINITDRKKLPGNSTGTVVELVIPIQERIKA